ncbi:MAG: type II secretion system F family protein [Phycisphaerae bacterium]|nr:type II secretion system F family protein [Phycisphaerae bacterium]
MNLTYEAIDGSGRNVCDMVEAPSVKEAVDSLRQKGLFVTHIARAKAEEMQQKLAAAGGELGKVRFSLRQLVMFTRQMAMLLAAGSGVVPALNALTRQIKDVKQRAVINQIIANLEEGYTLADAMQKYPNIFDASYGAVIAAGEASATLAQMFTKLAGIMGKRKAMRNKVVGSVTYPVLLIMLCVGILNVMLFFVIPRFGDMFDTLAVPLPASTKFMLALSGWLREWWMVPAGLVVAFIVAVVYLVKSKAGRQFLSDVQIQVPMLGRVMSRLIQAEILRILGMLIEAKVGILDALDLARGVTSNRRYHKLSDDIEQAVTSGEGISSAMERSRLIDPSICQAIRTGEESGSLGESISYVADVLDEENAELVDVTTKLLEPIILIGMGVVVGIVAVSLFMPLFDITAAV